MQRITNLLQKLSDLSCKTGEPEIIDIDLMLDYTKVIYADLLEARGRIAFNTSLASEAPVASDTHNNSIPAAEALAPLLREVKIQEETVDNGDVEVMPKTVLKTELIAPAIVATNTNPDVDIRKIIGINDKYQFISGLFNSNNNAYEEVLTKLNSFNSYPEAIGWLDEVHSENNWSDDNDTVVSFYNVINHYFASK
ncbi:MAG: hypothetical protein EOP51_03600 [Sphingobacteriales bacterium]|nr:MAG: hypothetical protein EOP51_03600 [Sphingobacteriales bacterium]